MNPLDWALLIIVSVIILHTLQKLLEMKMQVNGEEGKVKK